MRAKRSGRWDTRTRGIETDRDVALVCARPVSPVTMRHEQSSVSDNRTRTKKRGAEKLTLGQLPLLDDRATTGMRLTLVESVVKF